MFISISFFVRRNGSLLQIITFLPQDYCYTTRDTTTSIVPYSCTIKYSTIFFHWKKRPMLPVASISSTNISRSTLPYGIFTYFSFNTYIYMLNQKYVSGIRENSYVELIEYFNTWFLIFLTKI